MPTHVSLAVYFLLCFVYKINNCIKYHIKLPKSQNFLIRPDILYSYFSTGVMEFGEKTLNKIVIVLVNGVWRKTLNKDIIRFNEQSISNVVLHCL